MEESVNRSGTDPVGKGEKKSFNKRAFVSIVMFISGLLLPVSGIMLHELQFEPLTTARHFWMSVHNMAAFLFTIFVVIHISYNWRCLIRYAKKIKGIAVSKEAVMAILLVVMIVGLFSSHAFHVR
jgi:hypothetical protein